MEMESGLVQLGNARGGPQLVEWLKTFEETCLHFQYPETKASAELNLLQWRNLPDALSIFSEILKQTKISFCQFQAVLILKDVVIKRWLEMDSKMKEDFESFLLHFVQESQIEAGIENVVLQIVAIMNKKTWEERQKNESTEEEGGGVRTYCEALFQRINETLGSHASNNANLSSSGVSGKQGIGIRWLNALICEFSFRDSKANALGLNWETHYTCFKSFQRHALPHSFYLALQQLQFLTKQSNNWNVSQPTMDNFVLLQLLKDSLALVNQIFDWNFEESEEETQSISFHFTPNRTGILYLSARWKQLLFDTETLPLFFHLSNKLKVNEEFIHLTFSIIGQLASISGSIFEEFPALKCHYYFPQIMSGVIQMSKESNFHQLIQVSELADIFQKVGMNLKWEGLTSVKDGLQPFLQEVTAFTIKCMDLLSHTKDESNQETLENSLNVLFEFWIHLLDDSNADPVLLQWQGQLFPKYIEARLSLSNQQLNQFNEEKNEETREDIVAFREQLESVAFLGRANPLASVNVLYGYLESRYNTWKAVITSFHSHNPPSIPNNFHILLEEIHWLVLIVGHLIADEGDGEIPEIPETLESINQNGMHPIVEVSMLMFRLLSLETECLKANRFSLISPLLGQTFMWYLLRWSKTYLMSNFQDEILLKTFGPKSGSGLESLDFIIQKVSLNFEQWSGETPMLKYAAKIILNISQTSRIASSLFSLSSWKNFLDLYLRGHETFSLKIPLDIQKTLLQSFVTLSDYIGNGEEMMNYFWQVVNPLKSLFESIVSQPNFQQMSQTPQVMETICAILAQYRGIARASISNEEAIFLACCNCFPVFNQFVEIYSPSIALMVLKFYYDFCECQSETLSPESAHLLFSSLLHLIQTYSKAHLFHGKLQKRISEHQEKEEYKGLLLILKILSIIASNSNVKNERVAVFTGLSSILPLITKDILQFPKLCRAFFELISVLFQECSQKVASLPPDLFASLINSLQFGIQHAEVEISMKSIEGLNALLKYNVKCAEKRQHAGLAMQLDHNPLLLVNLLRFTLEFLLFHDFSNEILGVLSHLLFSLICTIQPTYFALVSEFLQRYEPTPPLQQRLADAFHNLLNPSQFRTLTLTRHNFQQFEKNVNQFNLSVKGFLLQK